MLFFLLCASFALGVGCSGGGGSSPAPIAPATTAPTATPTATPLPVKSIAPTASSSPSVAPSVAPIVTASPTPVPTAPPASAAIANTSRPLHDGDKFSYAGQTLQTFVYNGATPNPSATMLATVTQSVAVSGNASFNGASGLYDFRTTESDTTPVQQTTLTTDTFYGTVSGPGSTTDLVDYGFTSADSRGEKLGVTFTNPGPTNGLVDVLPETSGAAWSNTGAQTIAQSEADGFSARRTYAADGTYADTATYPQAGAANPSATPLTATITDSADGSATYSLPLFGPPNVTIAYSAPSSSGAISIVLSQPGPGPTSPPQTFQSTAVGRWYQAPLRLFQELDRDNGAVTIPATCNVPATYGTQANEIEQKSVRVDPVLGTLETFDQLTYVVPTTGVVCVQLQDRTLTYYDYSGQGNGSPTGISYAGGNSPLETTTIATTIGLTGATVAPMSLRRESTAGASGLRLATVRSSFLALVEQRRTAAQRRAFQHLRTTILERMKR